MLGDPFLNYFALGLLIFVVIVIFYGIIAIHDTPAQIAKSGIIHMRTRFMPQAGLACSPALPQLSGAAPEQCHH